MLKPLAAPVLAILLSACAVGPVYDRPDQELPDQWPRQQVLDSEEQQDWQRWWTRYEDPVLTTLVERALSDNLTLSLQIDRIQEARALLGLSQANRWPLLSAQANAAREQQAAAGSPFMLNGGPQTRLSLSGILSYEVDLWGRLERQQEAAAALLEQTVYGADAIHLNLITDVVTSYFNLRAAQQQLRLTEATRDLRERTLNLEEIRYEGGAGDPLAVRQARASLASVEANIPSLRQQVSLIQNSLAVLAGFTPEELLGDIDFGNSGLDDINLPESIPAFMPSELLNRRPDIRAAEAGLMAATAEIGVARASRLPTINLNALIGSAALRGSDLFTNAAENWSVGATAGGPLFDFGRGRAGVDSAEARRDQVEAQYQLTVLTAFREVRDALTLFDTADQRIQAIQRQVDAIRETEELAQLRYDEGAIGFYELLDAQRDLLNAELLLSDAFNQRLAATATLFKAMGGGWTSQAE